MIVSLFTEQLVKAVRERSRQMEESGTFARELLPLIYEHKLFKLFVPSELGGRMTPLPEALRIFEQAAWVDGSFGWLVTIGSGGGFFAPAFTSSAVRLFASPEAVIAGSGHPSGVAKRVDGGYRVSGKWKFCSGSAYATMFTANCVIEPVEASEALEALEATGEGPQIRSFIFMPEQVEIIKDWNSFGLKATESHSIQVADAFVPDERTFDIFTPQSDYRDPIYTYPFLPFAEASFAVVSLGVGRHFVEEARAMLARNKESWEASRTNRYAFVAELIDRAELQLGQAGDDFYRMIGGSWDRYLNGMPFSEPDLEQISRQCKATAQTSLACANSVFPYMGIAAVMEDTPLNRIFRDLQTVCHHTMLVAFQKY